MRYRSPFFTCNALPCSKLSDSETGVDTYIIPVGMIVLPETQEGFRVIAKEEGYWVVEGLGAIGKISNQEAETLRNQIEVSNLINHLSERMLDLIHEQIPDDADCVLLVRGAKPSWQTPYYCQN